MPHSISPNDLALSGKGDNWEDKLLNYLQDDVFPLLDEKIHEEADLAEYNEELAATLGSLSRYEYLARGERDRALAEGFSMFPKGKHNSDEQIALARNHASHADRLHKMLQDITEAIRLRLSTGQNRVNFLREQMKQLQ